MSGLDSHVSGGVNCCISFLASTETYLKFVEAFGWTNIIP
jgi:hypothetical protein